jgi:aryl-alcohol dehydrogenase-like predicted oxidoreductase
LAIAAEHGVVERLELLWKKFCTVRSAPKGSRWARSGWAASLSGIYGAANDPESEDLIRQAIDRGIDRLDSSDMYGWGHNEEVVGRAIKGRRDQVVLIWWSSHRVSTGGQLQNAEKGSSLSHRYY